jgi:polyhydroxyalkanoate synthesis regulator phasin
MPRDDRFRRVQEAGADFLETARARAEEFLRELSRAGEDTSGRAQGALDEIIGESRKGTEHLVNSIRKEISTQLGMLGLATKEDLAALERRLTGKATAAPKKAAAKSAGSKSTGSRSAAAPKAAGASKPAAKKSPAKQTAAKKTAG